MCEIPRDIGYVGGFQGEGKKENYFIIFPVSLNIDFVKQEYTWRVALFPGWKVWTF